MYMNPINEVKNEGPIAADIDGTVEDQLAKNSFLQGEIEHFAKAMVQVMQSRTGRLALTLERLIGYVRFSRPVSLNEIERIAVMPLEEREDFRKPISPSAFSKENTGNDYLIAEYMRQTHVFHCTEASNNLDEESTRAFEDENAELYQLLLKSQASVGRSLSGVSGFLLRFLEFVWNTLQFGRGRGYLRSLWGDFVEFRRSHATDMNTFNANSFNRLHYFLQVLRYALAHPYACLRIFSWRRFWRLARILLGLEQVNGAAWIDQRFPPNSTGDIKPVIFSVDEAGASALELSFPIVDDPLVSIIIPVYNQYAMTLSCLQAVLAHSLGISYEVIIADDRSCDLTQTISDRIKNIRVVRNDVNLGFLKNCNNAVGHAKGKYIVLLNNDTNPQPGWLQALLDVFSVHAGVGLVGPKLLFEDGILQEAGGIIWRDGSGWNFGRGQNPDAPEFNYLKDVDYISGACVMLEKSLWDELGGFDERFCPAYYEDTDLAFQIRVHGLCTVYQPASCVVHFEGVSHGSDLNSGVKKQQRINQTVFQKKWEKILCTENHTVGANVFNARERAGRRRTVLFIDHYVPFYDKDAGSRSTFLYVKVMLEMGYRVKFLGANFFPHQPYTEALQSMGVEVLYGERYARSLKTWLKENAKFLDVIYLHRPHVTEAFIEEILALKKRPKLVYFGHDLHFLRTEREGAVKGDQKLLEEASSWKERERNIFRQVDTVLYPSDVEVRAVRELEPDINVDQIPLYLLTPQEQAEFCHDFRKDLLFVGGFTHGPNVDAVIWFVSEVLPIVLESEPGIRFHVVGSNVPEVISVLASENVIVHGFVEDEVLSQLYRDIRVCVVPLRYGAGVKGKVLEALQAGVPLITTPIGAEGIPDAESVMTVAEGVRSFARGVLALCNDEQDCLKQLEGRADYMERYFSLDVVKAAIKRHFGQPQIE